MQEHAKNKLRVHVWKSLTPDQPKQSLKLWPSSCAHEHVVYAEVNGIAYTTSNSFLHAIMKNFEAVCALENGLEYNQSALHGPINNTNVAVEHIEQNITRLPSSHIKITFDLHWDADGERHSDTRFFAPCLSFSHSLEP